MHKKVRKMVLENVWRIEEHESWFADMAKEGWHLQKVGRLFVYFEQGEPKDVRYRVDTSSNKQITAEDKEMFQEAGWTHIARLGEFNVFSSLATLQAPELHTDPIEQSFTLRDLSKKFWRGTIVIIILSILGAAASLFFSRPFILVLIEGEFMSFVAIFTYVFAAFTMLEGSLAIRKLIKTLQTGNALDHHAPWRIKRTVTLTIQGMMFLLVIANIIMMFVQIALDQPRTIPIESDTSPIVRLAEIEQNSNLVIKQYDKDGPVGWLNSYTYNWSPFAPIQYQANESGVIPEQVWSGSDRTYSPGLYMQVYQLWFPTMKDNLIDALIQESNFRGEVTKVESDTFDILFIHQEEGLIEVFAAKGKGVIELRYYGHAASATILSVIEEKIALIEK
ncbi:DUF2812 domain-containing protein [Sporosarcina beigongshangi]|uniref:DUF2812 domain-containing protein n=1 Tax=Sporosarcina beigongshangi TaxID=2782538 RepID=UPI00193A8F80|nr:DUF2812 domain-containing protein [Sporosarcina beigongshangi]